MTENIVIEQRTVIHYLMRKGKKVEEIHGELINV